MINYSIIIPHKNIPDLLRRCLDSIPRREDVQIIVVDDNSDPEMIDFDSFPGLNQPCVEVYFTKEGKGAGYARNVGLEHAVGKWVLFADADDLYVPGMLDILDCHIASEADIIIFNYEKRDSSASFVKNDMYDMIKCVRNADFTPNMLSVLKVAPWCKMCSRNFLSDHYIMFDECSPSDDVMWSTMIAVEASNIGIDENVLYIHYSRDGSQERTYDTNAFNVRYEVHRRQVRYVRSLGLKQYERVFIWYFERVKHHYQYRNVVKLGFMALRDRMITSGKALRMIYYYRHGRKRNRYPVLFILLTILKMDSIGKYMRRLCKFI